MRTTIVRVTLARAVSDCEVVAGQVERGVTPGDRQHRLLGTARLVRLAWFTEPKLAGGGRKMVDQTGIEPVTS